MKEFEITESYINEVLNKIEQKSKDQVDEGLKDWITAPLIAAVMAIPGVVDAKDLAKNYPRNATRADVIKALEYETSSYDGVSGYTFAQAVDILARTLYMEAANQGEDGMIAVMSVIWNRAGGDIEKIIPVVFQRGQFCGWNGAKPNINSGKYSTDNYDFWIPEYFFDQGKDNKIPISKAKISQPALNAWNKCKEIAADVFKTGNFKSTIGNCNMILNKAKDEKDFYNFWKDKAKYTVNSHEFAYDPMYDGWLTPTERAEKSKEFRAEYGSVNSPKAQVTTTKSSNTDSDSTADAKKVEKQKDVTPKSFTSYTIKDGDNLDTIARNMIKSGEITYTKDKNQVVKDILKSNPQIKIHKKYGYPNLQIGKTIKIPK